MVRLTARFVWISYMMHVYDGYNPHDLPRWAR